MKNWRERFPGLTPRWILITLSIAFALAIIGGALFIQRGVVATGPGSATATGTATAGASTPAIAVRPAVATPGTQLTITGQRWRAGDVLFLRLQSGTGNPSAQAVYPLATVGADGTFSAQFTFPADPAWNGVTAVDLTAYSPTTGDRATTPLQIAGTNATATPGSGTATPSPAPGSSGNADRSGFVTAGTLNVRSGPGTGYGTVGTVAYGMQFTVLGQNTAGDWLYVNLANGLTGWVYRAYTNFSGQVSAVPAPPPPSPTATGTPRPTATPAATATPAITEWRGEYYANAALTGAPVLVRNDSTIDFNWGTGSPAAEVPADNFSVRWTRTLTFQPGQYRFHARVDDGVRVWVDGSLVIDGWTDGAQRELTGDLYLAAGTHAVRVEYYERLGGASITVWWELLPTPTYSDWKGEYWANPQLAGSPALVRNDPGIDFTWTNTSPDPAIPGNGFSARWSRWVNFDAGMYRFYARADDGVRVYVDGALIIDQWHDNAGTQAYTADLPLEGAHWLVVAYYQDNGPSLIKVWWAQTAGPEPTTSPSPSPTATATPSPTPTASPTPAPSPTPTATLTPTATPTATPSPTPTSFPLPAGVRLNEVLTNPASIDWDGNGVIDTGDQWIELFNGGRQTIDLTGWALNAGTAQSPRGGGGYLFPAGSVMHPGSYLVLFGSQTGLVLKPAGDRLTLIDAADRPVDVVALPSLAADDSYSRDANDVWHSDWPPTPGSLNAPGLPPAH